MVEKTQITKEMANKIVELRHEEQSRGISKTRRKAEENHKSMGRFRR